MAKAKKKAAKKQRPKKARKSQRAAAKAAAVEKAREEEQAREEDADQERQPRRPRKKSRRRKRREEDRRRNPRRKRRQAQREARDCGCESRRRRSEAAEDRPKGTTVGTAAKQAPRVAKPSSPRRRSNSYYITTAIAYPNGAPHIGHAYEAIATDALARFQRLDGKDVFFLTGTDEHGLKMIQTAQAEGMTVAGARYAQRRPVQGDGPAPERLVRSFHPHD